MTAYVLIYLYKDVFIAKLKDICVTKWNAQMSAYSGG